MSDTGGDTAPLDSQPVAPGSGSPNDAAWRAFGSDRAPVHAEPVATGPADPAVPSGPAISDPATVRRLRRPRVAGWVAVAVGLAAFVAAVAGIAIQANAAMALLDAGARTPGTVTYYSPGSGRFSEGYFDVTYVAEGVTRAGVINLDSASPSYAVGERVTVVYDRHDPTRIRTTQEQNEPPSTVLPLIFGLVGGPFVLIFGWIVLVRVGRWNRVLAGAPWVAYDAQYVRPLGGSPGFLISPQGASTPSPIPIIVKPFTKWQLGRLAQAAPSTIWIAGNPQFDVVIAIPQTRELVGASPPRGRTGRRFLDALRASRALANTTPPAE